MEAKEMFENLDYFEVARTNKGLWYQNSRNNDFVFFDLEKKEYSSWSCNYYADYITRGISIELHKAITQQLKELGELDE